MTEKSTSSTSTSPAGKNWPNSMPPWWERRKLEPSRGRQSAPKSSRELPTGRSLSGTQWRENRYVSIHLSRRPSGLRHRGHAAGLPPRKRVAHLLIQIQKHQNLVHAQVVERRQAGRRRAQTGGQVHQRIQQGKIAEHHQEGRGGLRR